MLQLAFLKADGAHDVHRQLDLSGEPLVPPLRKSFQLRDPIPLLEYQDLTLQGKTYSEAYLDYWNSTAQDDGWLRHLQSPISHVLKRATRSGRRRRPDASGASCRRHTRKVLPYGCVLPKRNNQPELALTMENMLQRTQKAST